MADLPKRGVLLALAAEGMVPVLGGCAGALMGGPEAGIAAGMIGVAVGQTVEKVINFFGGRIVYRWSEWFRNQSPEVRQQALAELASMPPEEARKEAESILDKLVLEPLAAPDKEVALSYLSLLPGALDRALPRDMGTGMRSLPLTISVEEPHQLLTLLPVTLPPYPIGSDVPGTPYHLDALLGSGGFGAVYRASTRSLQHLPLAVKFCLDPTLAQALHRERANLERLMKAGGQDWSPRIVRLYGYDLEHQTPYLVYEFVTGGDLIRYLGERREKLGRTLDTQEVLELIVQVTEALAFAHEHGLVHRDLKPANVLVEGGVLKLADFGLGGVTAARAVQVSRIGATTVDQLSIADQASLFRGAGTPLYMAPEQRRGQAPDPRHDLYSLGVIWYQLLVGDVSREMHPGWARELSLRFAVPQGHIRLIDACVGWFDERPKNAGELLTRIREMRAEPTAPALPPSVPATQPPPLPASAPVTMRPLAMSPATVEPADEMRQSLLTSLVRQLHETHGVFASFKHPTSLGTACVAAVGFLVFVTSEARLGFFVSLLFAVMAAMAVLIGFVLYGYGRRAEARERLVELIRTLTSEFPEIVRGWGGESMLRNADVVAQIADKMGLVPRPPAEPVLQAGAFSSEVAKKLQPRLHQLGEKVEYAGTFSVRRPLPWPLAILLALALGAGAGVGSGFAFWGYRAPIVHRGFRGPEQFVTADGTILERAPWIREDRQTTATAVLVGVAAGLGVALFVGLSLTRRQWYRSPFFVGAFLGLALGGGAGAGSGFLHETIRGPYLDHSSPEIKYYDMQGRSLTPIMYQLENRKTTTTSILLGVLVGLGVLLSVLLTWQNRYHRRATTARQEAEEEAQKLATDFPEVVGVTGGVEGLTKAETLAELRQQIDKG